MSASQFDVRPSPADYWRGLKVQARVVNALMIRELMMRYGRANIGFLWLILEPMILCGGVIGLRWFIQSHEEHGISLVAFLLSGYMPLTLWRHLTNSRGLLAKAKYWDVVPSKHNNARYFLYLYGFRICRMHICVDR